MKQNLIVTAVFVVLVGGIVGWFVYIQSEKVVATLSVPKISLFQWPEYVDGEIRVVEIPARSLPSAVLAMDGLYRLEYRRQQDEPLWSAITVRPRGDSYRFERASVESPARGIVVVLINKEPVATLMGDVWVRYETDHRDTMKMAAISEDLPR